MRKIICILIILTGIICCNSKENDNVKWIKRSPIKIQYIYSINREVYCWGYEEGYLKINKNGEIINKEIFDKDDKRNLIINIKTIPDVGVYAYMGTVEGNKHDYKNKDDWMWIIELKENGEYEKYIDIPEYILGEGEFLISLDKKKYCIFSLFRINNDEDLPYLWLDKDIWTHEKKGNDFYKDIMNEYKKNNKMNQIGPFGRPGKIYFINNKYYDDGWYIYYKSGEKIKYIDNEIEYNIGQGYGGLGNFNHYQLNDFIYGDDNYFYIIYMKPKDSHYCIIKADEDLNLVGKRLIKSIKNNDGRCVTGIYVDKDGYMYVTSDTDMTVVKHAPIEKGEDSFFDLRGLKVEN